MVKFSSMVEQTRRRSEGSRENTVQQASSTKPCCFGAGRKAHSRLLNGSYCAVHLSALPSENSEARRGPCVALESCAYMILPKWGMYEPTDNFM